MFQPPTTSQSAHNLSGYLPSSAQYSSKPLTPTPTSPIPPPAPTVPPSTPASTGTDQQQSQQIPKGGRRVGGKENHYSRKKVKSPDLLETTFTMSTIEEEMEGVNIGHSYQDRI